MNLRSCRRHLLGGLAILGLAGLCFVLGSAVISFNLPPSTFLKKAFEGALAWQEQRRAEPQPETSTSQVVTTNEAPQEAFNGYTLEMAAGKGADTNCEAVLIDMYGTTVHKWRTPFSQVWPDPAHRRAPVSDSRVCFFDGHLFPNGDLLVVFHGFSGMLPGHGLAKLDRDSHVLWKYSFKIHHDLDVDDDGTIYAIRQEIVREMPSGLEHTRPPCVVDYLVMLSPEGKDLAEPIPLLEAFRDSPYSAFVSGIAGWPSELAPPAPEQETAADILHTNCVDVLSRELAPKFPMFKTGQIMVSIRELDTIAVVDPQSRSIVWATRGPWRRQHDAHFLDNGHILMFDNLGADAASRVLEYDPKTQAIPWSYSCSFVTDTRGMSQRLPNGNTLVVHSEAGLMQEITRSGAVVWSRSRPGFMHLGRRYSPEQLPFLSEVGH